MLIATRITNLRWLHRPLLPAPHRLRIGFKSSSSSSSEAQGIPHFVDEECRDFLPWLEQKAGTEISSVLSIGNSAYGRSLLASKIIHAGDCILNVPFNVQISPDNLLPEIKSLLGDEIGHVAKLAVVILFEQKMGQNSEWAQYFNHLPQPGVLHSTIFWSESELEMIHLSTVYQETSNQKAQIEKEYLAIRPVLDHFPGIFEDVLYKDFMHAYCLVGSRAWGSTKGVSLIPFADFLNHDGVSEAMVLSDEYKQCSEVFADRNYDIGEQVLIRYGKFSNATLLLDFGFTLPYNIYDQVQIRVNIPHHDLLHDMKLELLQRNCVPTPKAVNGVNSSVDSFILKEVRSARGKGKGIPQSLRAFARVLSCTSPAELGDLATEAAQNDGRLARRSLKNISKEIQAHQILLSHITELIEEYDASIKSLKLVKSPSKCEKHTLRRQMARDLLTGELRILKSASAWLKNYCTTLTTTDYHQQYHK